MKLVYKNNMISDTIGNMSGATSESAGSAGLVPAPLSTDRDKYLKGDGTWSTVVNDVMTGATSNANGTSGLVPQPLIADKDKYLKGDGTWGAISIPSSGPVSKQTTFNANGSITEETDEYTLVTTFNSNGSITETYTYADSSVVVKTTTFSGDAISEVVS